MARPAATPQAPPTGEVATPLQMVLTGTFLISLILAPVVAFALYLSPLYKAPDALYRGTYFIIGLCAAVVIALGLSIFWMSYLPDLLERRETRRGEREKAHREARREAGRKARAEQADVVALAATGEEE